MFHDGSGTVISHHSELRQMHTGSCWRLWNVVESKVSLGHVCLWKNVIDELACNVSSGLNMRWYWWWVVQLNSDKSCQWLLK